MPWHDAAFATDLPWVQPGIARSNVIARSLQDLGAATWFGGLLMGATATNPAVGDIDDERQRGRVMNGVWRRWWPVSAAGIAAHLVGGALVTIGNRERLIAQRGVVSLSVGRSAVTGAALAATAYAGLLGKRISDAGDVPVADGTTPSAQTPSNIAQALRHEHVLQWVTPALVGMLIVAGAAQGEQQRPSHVLRGVLRRLDPTS